MRRRTVIKTLTGGAAALAVPGLALGQTGPIRIGELTDFAGPYRDNTGPPEEHAIRMAIQDFNGGKVLGRPIEQLVGDHLNKPDVATDIAKRWMDVDKVDMFIASGGSAAALAAHVLARERGVITAINSGTALNFTEQDCSPYGFHWAVDTYAYPRSGVLAAGDKASKKWFFVALDNVVGASAVPICTAAIQEAAGQVVGTVKTPINTTDFASFIAQAQASRADVVCVISGGADLARFLKQAKEFGLQAGGQTLVSPLLFFNDILAAGLDAAQGLQYAEGFYWDLNDATRAFSRRFQEKIGRPPSAGQACAYMAVTHYLQAVEAVKTTETKAVAARMHSQPVSTPMLSNASVRANGRVVYDLNILRVKSPAQSKSPADVAEVIGKLAGDRVFKPLAGTACKFV